MDGQSPPLKETHHLQGSARCQIQELQKLNENLFPMLPLLKFNKNYSLYLYHVWIHLIFLNNCLIPIWAQAKHTWLYLTTNVYFTPELSETETIQIPTLMHGHLVYLVYIIVKLVVKVPYSLLSFPTVFAPKQLGPPFTIHQLLLGTGPFHTCTMIFCNWSIKTVS